MQYSKVSQKMQLLGNKSMEGSSRSHMFFKIDVLRKLHRKTPVLESLFNNVFQTLLKTLQHRYFPVNMAKSSRKSILKNTCERLLLSFSPLYLLRKQAHVKITIKLTQFWPMFLYDTPKKHQKTYGFLVFSRGIKREQNWPELVWTEG